MSVRHCFRTLFIPFTADVTMGAKCHVVCAETSDEETGKQNIATILLSSCHVKLVSVLGSLNSYHSLCLCLVTMPRGTIKSMQGAILCCISSLLQVANAVHLSEIYMQFAKQLNYL